MWYGPCSKRISQLHTPRSSANGMNHTCLFLPSRSWYSFSDPGEMEGWVGLEALCCFLAVHVCICDHILKVHVINRLWESHQIYNFGAMGYKGELIRFGDQNIKVCCGWMHFNETYHSYLLPSLHDMETFLRSTSQRAFSKSALFQWRHTSQRFAVEHCLVCYYNFVLFAVRHIVNAD